VFEHPEEGKPVLGFLPSARSETAWRDRERAEVWTVEVAVEGARERSVRGDHPVVRFDLVVELLR